MKWIKACFFHVHLWSIKQPNPFHYRLRLGLGIILYAFFIAYDKIFVAFISEKELQLISIIITRNRRLFSKDSFIVLNSIFSIKKTIAPLTWSQKPIGIIPYATDN